MLIKRKTLAALAAFSIATASSFANETCDCCCAEPIRDRFNYVDIGVGPLPIPFPYFGIGNRAQNDCHGRDFSLQVATIGVFTQVKASALYLHYFHPNLYSQFYAGGGIGISGLFSHRKAEIAGSPEFVFGKQYINCQGDTRFFQMQTSFPTFTHHRPFYMPLVVFSYGIGF